MLPSTDLSITTRPPLVAVNESREQLQDAFARFSETAISLERSYSLLREEVSRLREELRRKQGELDTERERVRQAKALGGYSALLAHEVRNPLASMELFAELLLECGDLEQDARGWVEQLQAGLRILAMLTNNVLRMHEIAGAGGMSTLQIGNVLASTVQFLSPVAKQNSVQLAYEDRSGGATVAADLSRLQQLFLNLALNALHVSQPGGQVNFSVERIERADSREKGVRVKVQDFGRGISPEHRTRIFEPGFTTRPGSVGLGLAVCKKIVDQHNGKIIVDSVVGQGSNFIVELPAL